MAGRCVVSNGSGNDVPESVRREREVRERERRGKGGRWGRQLSGGRSNAVWREGQVALPSFFSPISPSPNRFPSRFFSHPSRRRISIRISRMPSFVRAESFWLPFRPGPPPSRRRRPVERCGTLRINAGHRIALKSVTSRSLSQLNELAKTLSQLALCASKVGKSLVRLPG